MSRFQVQDAAAMDALGMCMAPVLTDDAVVYLSGELGAGKTTLVRGVLRGLGFTGPVRSPTYTLMEAYEFPGRVFQHLDLYRIRDAAELEFLGVRELDAPRCWVFIEWPERGLGDLPPADLELRLELQDPGRHIEVGVGSERGHKLAQAWQSRVKAASILGLAIMA